MYDEVMDCLINADGYVSGQELAKKLGVSRQAVWKAVNSLRADGFEIESVSNRGYRLRSLPDSLNSAAVKAELKTAVIGRELEILDSVGSTNDYLKNLGAGGCCGGYAVAAREQFGGKGRLGRTWESSRDKNLAFSVLLRPKIAPYEASAITPLAGLAVCKALRSFTGLDCKIKWPNDIIVGRKKLVGILTEMSAEFDAVEYIVIGIGVNVNQGEFPEEIAEKATSLLLETGERTDLNKLLARLLEQLETEFINENLELSRNALAEYSSLCATLGREVEFTRGGRRLSGAASAVNALGELVVNLPDNTELTVNAGEVTAQGIY